MNIAEATKKSLKTGSNITRTGAWWSGSAKIRPTDGSDCCIISKSDGGETPCRGWQPKAEDLIAEDWELLD